MPTTSDLRHGQAFQPGGRSGSSLLIVLAFVVLLTGLILAFFSRSILEQQVSVSSANQVKVDNIAMQGVTATVSDLKQEIEEGSTINNPVSGNPYIYYYSPTASSGTYPTMLPAVTGSTTGVPPGSTFGTNKLAQGALLNLIKVSLHSQGFYPGSPWDNTETIPKRAPTTLPVSTGSTADSTGTIASGSSDGTSLNGRYISGTRWSKPLFLPSGTVFPLPDWIYCSRSVAGAVSNPTIWNANLIGSPANMGTTTTVVGRYAYAIYDEGSLLDINVAGTPTPMLGGSLAAYKNPLTMADLTQIPNFTQSMVDTVTGWRNNASATYSQGLGSTTAPSGSANTGYTWSASNATNYYLNVTFNPTGFLHPTSAWSSSPGTVGQTDQFFTSRQELIQFFKTALGGSTNVLNTLQYLTHFSRGLNQPSYQPAYNRPSVLALTSGGNDKGGGSEDNIGAASVIGTITKSTVNPSFLSARVGMFSGPSSFVRNDGSIANSGDPLVKKRFALSRLQWLTYLGPIADDNGLLFTNSSSAQYVGSSNLTNAQTIISQLENTYGYSAAFLAQGGPTNIQKYFGLVWVQDSGTSIGINDGTYKWKYEHGTKVSGNGVAGNSTTPGPICPLGYVATAGRDPDFFELLKATIQVGSIAKLGTASGSYLTPSGYQNAKDSSVDAFIIQLGANIINQSNLANYPVRILFDDGTWTQTGSDVVQEYRGVADLPYLYRMRGTYIKLTDSNPNQTLIQAGSPGKSGATTGYTSSTTGTGEFFQLPEIWSPFTWNASANPTLTLRPTKFQMIPLSADPVHINAGNKTSLGSIQVVAFTNCDGGGHTDSPTDPGEPAPFTINGENITFTIPATATGLSFFREPTLLNKPDPATVSGNLATDAGPPRGSLVSAGGANSLGISNAPITSWFKGACYTNGSGIVTSISGLTDNQQYLGFNFGIVPLWVPVPAATTITGSTTMSQSGGAVVAPNPSYITYQLQFLDPNSNDPASTYITYDEKFLPVSIAYVNDQFVNGFLLGTQNQTAYKSAFDPTTQGGAGFSGATNDQYMYDLIDEDNYEVVADPRTARFSTTVYSPYGYGAGFEPPPGNFVGAWGAWVDASQNALMTARPDYNVGWDVATPATTSAAAQALGFYNLQFAYSGGSPPGVPGFAMGVFEQNVMTGSYTANTGLYNGETQSMLTSSSPVTPEYYSDADGVVRRATAGYSAAPASPESATTPAPAAYNGLPLQTGTTYTNGVATPMTYNSRPIMLNRPFRSVAELGYVFSGTPWKNIDFSTPESGYAALLDVFCVNDTDDPNGLVAGKVNLNTRQPLVLQSILSGAYKDELYEQGVSTGQPPISVADATKLITDATNGLTTRTASTALGKGPLTNVADLVGRWVNATGTNPSFPLNGAATVSTSQAGYSGFSGDLTNIGTSDTSSPYAYQVQRFREAAIRALADSGQTRVWNVMIDVIAQTGHFPSTATALNNFYVEGEQRYWVHLAIDRLTGQVIDQQIEVVKE